MGQSLVGGLIGGASGAIPHLLTGNIPAALALGGIGFVGGFASSYMAKQATADALSSAMNGGEPKFGGYNVNRRGAALHHQVIYGQTKTGGVVVFDDAHGDDGEANTDNNKYLSRIIAYAGHEIESFEKIYIGGGYRVGTINSSTGAVTGVFAVDQNGEDVGSQLTGANNPFNGYLSIREVLGDHTASLGGQTFTHFSDDWTADHKLLGIAHLAILFEYVDDVWNEGLPEVTALIKGKKVYDPREAGHDVADPTTWEWSNNPALIVRDFLTNSVYGLGEDDANIDDTLVSTAANICEETIYPFLTDAVDIVSGTDYKIHTVGTTDFTAIGAADNNVGTVFTATGAGTGTGTAGKIEANVDKYTCNGAWTTSQAPVDVIAQLMTSCAGYLWYAQGKWRMKAGKYVAPTVTLTEDDLRSPISVATRHSRRDNFNAVRGTFRGPKSNYQFTDYPTVTAANLVIDDGGLESTMDLALPFTDTPEEAQRLANIALEKNREQITITGSFGLNAFSLQVGDNVNITNTRFGWTNKLFEVVAWSLSAEDYQLNVNLVLRETATGTYDEYAHTDFESNNTNLPGALGEVVVGGVSPTLNPVGLTAGGGLRQNKISWTNPINDNWHATEVYHDTSSTYTPLASAASYSPGTVITPTDFEYIPTNVTATSTYFEHDGSIVYRIREDISSLTTGKYYFEVHVDQNTSSSFPVVSFGLGANVYTSGVNGSQTGEVGGFWNLATARSDIYLGSTTGEGIVFTSSSSTGSGILCIAWDEDNGNIWFGFAPDQGAVEWRTGSSTSTTTFPAADPTATGVTINHLYLGMNRDSNGDGERIYLNSGGNPTFNGQVSGNYDSTWFYEPPSFGTPKLVTVTGESYVHTGLQPASTHYYWVKAISDASGTALGSSTPIGASGGSTGVGATTLRAETDDLVDNAVVTDKVSDNAITESSEGTDIQKQNSAVWVIEKTSSGSSATWQDLAEVTINRTGVPVLISWDLVLECPADSFKKVFLALLKGNTELWETGQDHSNYNNGANAMAILDREAVSGSYLDETTGTGSTTYKISAARGQDFTNTITKEKASIQVTELKK